MTYSTFKYTLTVIQKNKCNSEAEGSETCILPSLGYLAT